MWGWCDMRTLNRNKQAFFYANYAGTEDVSDSAGNYTGVKRVLYTDPKVAHGNISAARGDASVVDFGVSVDYDSVIVLSETDMDESSVLWIGAPLVKPHNYIVKRVSRSPNGVAIAVKRVDVGA